MKTLIILTTILTWNGEQRISSSVVTDMPRCVMMEEQINEPRPDSEIVAKSYCSELAVYND